MPGIARDAFQLSHTADRQQDNPVRFDTDGSGGKCVSEFMKYNACEGRQYERQLRSDPQSRHASGRRGEHYDGQQNKKAPMDGKVYVCNPPDLPRT
jgi:hypothetical protein